MFFATAILLLCFVFFVGNEKKKNKQTNKQTNKQNKTKQNDNGINLVFAAILS